MKPLLLSIITTAFLSSCAQETTRVMRPRVNVEAAERAGNDIQPNLNHGQHQAGANAIDYSNPGESRGWYGYRRDYRYRHY